MSKFDTMFAQRLESTLFRQMDDSITYTPKGGAGVSIKAILSEVSHVEEDGDNGKIQVHKREAIILRDAASELGGVAEPKIDDSATIDSVVWPVKDLIDESPSAVTLVLVRTGKIEEGRPRATRRA